MHADEPVQNNGFLDEENSQPGQSLNEPLADGGVAAGLGRERGADR